MKVHSFYDPLTGLFVGRTFAGPEGTLERNIPPGHAAIEGIHDHLSKKVDLKTGDVVDHQPPQPTPDHEWHSQSKRWRLSPDADARQLRRASAKGQIDMLERKALRMLRELALDPAAVDAAGVPIKERLGQLDKEIAIWRESLT